MSDCSCEMFHGPACTACEPPAPVTPLSLYNRPGLSSLIYRVGTFPAFRQAMLDARVITPVRSVDQSNARLFNQLATWSSDDYGVAIQELWAYVLDVLTFYQQSIANEAFLRTARLRESLALLANLLGYEPGRGVAATALLAFFADTGASLNLPLGLRMQSIPPPGKNPSTFELSTGVAINSAANQPVLLGTPSAAVLVNSGDLAPGGDAGGPAVTAGTKLAFFNASTGWLAEQVATSVAPTRLGGKRVNWAGSLNAGAGMPVASGNEVARFGRKFRLYGSNAPASFPLYDPSSQKWSYSQTDFTVSPSVPPATLYLDGTFDGIAQGSRVLIYYGGGDKYADAPVCIAANVLSVSQGVGQVFATPADGSAEYVAQSSSCTVLTIDQPLRAIWWFPTHAFFDLRTLVIYELIGPDLQFPAQTDSDNIPAGSATLYITDGSGIRKGAGMILVSGALSDVVTATADAIPSAGSSTPPWSVNITPQLANDYIASQSLLYANVASSTNGETQIEQVLGNGDASQEWQEFKVSPKPVTYVPDPLSDTGASSTLQVFVNEVEWTEVNTFFGHGPDETIFTTREDDQGVIYVRFGDGNTGRRLPTGTRNVTALLRKGLGSDGNVAAGTVSVILQPQPGLKAVINPLPGYGGEDAELAASIQQTAPGTVITLGRAVSLNDYEVLSLSYSGVAKARAVWADFQSRRGVTLTVAATGGKSLSQLAQPLRAFLDDHRDPNVPLRISDYAPVHFYFSATLHLSPGNKQSVVQSAAQAAFGPNADGSGYLGFNQLQFGQTMFQSALISVLQDVEGVDWVELHAFYESPSAAGHGYGAVATAREAILIGPQEVAWPTLDDSPTLAVELQYSGGVNDLEGP